MKHHHGLGSQLHNGANSIFDRILICRYFCETASAYGIYEQVGICEGDVILEYERSCISSKRYQREIHGFCPQIVTVIGVDSYHRGLLSLNHLVH